MASDGSRKFKEKRSRAAKPYDRPKGLIRRVTDSVTGLFASSWLSGWIASEEDEDAGDSQANSQSKTEAPPGESFIFAQPVRQSFRPIYPEEGENESSNQLAHGINVGASTSTGSGLRMNLATSSIALPTASSLSTESISPVARRQPIISSTPAGTQMFTRTKSQLEPRPVPLLTSATQTGDDASEFSESSAETGVDASVIPRPDERDYQREILQLDDESLQTLRETAPAVAANQPTIEETRKRPRETEPDQASSRAEGSIASNRSLFSESGEVSLSQPQPSALASKRPRFNVSAYGSPLMHDRSVLSDSSFRMSPFYPGKTMYGGASAYRKGRLSRPQTPRVQVKPKPAESSDDAGLSRTARRILECLEQMSTPISDAKRIPIPVSGQRSSFLDATAYTAVYHKQRQMPRKTGPPASNRSMPAKVPPPEKCAYSTNGASKEVVSTSDPGVSTSEASTSEPTVSEPSQLEEESPPPPVKTWGETPAFSVVPKPPEVTAAQSHFVNFEKAGGKVKSKVVSSGRTSARQEMNEVQDEVHLPSVSLTMSSLPKIDLTSPILTRSATPPKVTSEFSFASPLVVHGDEVPTDISLSSPVFTFRSPAVVGHDSTAVGASASVPSVPLLFNSCVSSTAPKMKELSKKKPSPAKELKEGSILDILKPKRNSTEAIPSWVPPVFNNIDGKSTSENPLANKTDEVNPRGLESPEQNTALVNSTSKKTEVSTSSSSSSSTSSSSSSNSSSQAFQGFSAFMKSSDEWECSVCMLRNKNTVEECVACKTVKPGLNSSSNTANVIVKAAAVDQPVLASNSIAGGWGNAFKKSDNEWECETCMIRNKDSSDKCVACETPRPGSKSEPKLLQDSSSSSSKLITENKVEKTNLGFGNMFAKAKGEWECDTCLVRNKSDASKCSCCDAPKPGATAAVSQAITGNFKFGVDNKNSSTSSFKFGVLDSQSEVKQSEFKFGVSAKTTGESLDNSKGMGEGSKSSNLTEGSKDVSVGSSSSNNNNSSSNNNFTFGVKPPEQKEADSKFPIFSFSSNKLNETKAEPVSAIKTGISFGAVGSSKSGFNFTAAAASGGLLGQEKKDGNDSSKEPKSSSVSDAVKSSATTTAAAVTTTTTTTSLFTFGSKPTKSEGESAVKSTPPSIFNHSLSGLHKEPTKVPSFGNLSGKDSGFGSSLLFGSKPAETTTTTTNNTTSTTTTTTTNSFTSGGTGTETSKASGGASFSFFSPPPPPSTSESKLPPAAAPVPSFTFGSKGETQADADDAPKKMTFGLQNTNNNIKSSSKLFTFGSKENTTSFAPPPNSTPAFGAPAPTIMNPPFQFGQNNNPTPAATAPAPSFGSASSAAFGSSDLKPAFAFGQGPPKSGAGYDFGQAANSFPAPVFNFGAVKPNDTSAAVFQFGNTVNSETPAFGGENAFAPAPPSGRVVKKARRRRQ